MKLFCFGLGYCAQNLINELSSTTWQYSGTHRTTGEFIFDGDGPLQNSRKILNDVTHLLISIAPNKEGKDPVFEHHRNDIINMPNLKWVGYLSATSIYGDHGGEWIDEKTLATPTDARGRARHNAEKQWLSLKLPLHIFRLGGIYGPDRNQIGAVKKNKAQKIIKADQVFSRIHVDDISSALKYSMENPNPGGIYNIVDDTPSSSADVLDFICGELSLPTIEGIALESADISPMMKSFYADNKRVKNNQAKKDLNWRLKFPTFKHGYLDILSKLNKR